MSEPRTHVDQSLVELEAKIKRRGKWRGRWVFYQVLESDLAPILQAAGSPAHVRERVAAMLAKHGYKPEAPPLPGPLGDMSHFCRTFDGRGSGPGQSPFR